MTACEHDVHYVCDECPFEFYKETCRYNPDECAVWLEQGEEYFDGIREAYD